MAIATLISGTTARSAAILLAVGLVVLPVSAQVTVSLADQVVAEGVPFDVDVTVSGIESVPPIDAFQIDVRIEGDHLTFLGYGSLANTLIVPWLGTPFVSAQCLEPSGSTITLAGGCNIQASSSATFYRLGALSTSAPISTSGTFFRLRFRADGPIREAVVRLQPFQIGNGITITPTVPSLRISTPTTAEQAGETLQSGFSLAELYPVPAAGNLHATLESDEAGSVSVRMEDLLGRVVTSATSVYVLPGRHALPPVNVTHLAPGMYLLRVERSSRSGLQATTRLIPVTGSGR